MTWTGASTPVAVLTEVMVAASVPGNLLFYAAMLKMGAEAKHRHRRVRRAGGRLHAAHHGRHLVKGAPQVH